MPATVIVNEWNTGPTQTDKTSGTVRFKNADNASVDTTNPLVIPASGQEFSYEKWLRLQITGTPPTDRIDAIECYTDGINSFGTGVSLWMEASGKSTQTFRNPGIPDEANATPLIGSGSTTAVDAFIYSSGNTYSLGAGAFSASSTHIGNFAVLVMEVDSTASPGATNVETFTFEYDEI